MKNKDKMHVGAQYKERDTAYIVHPLHKNLTSGRDTDDIIEEIEGLGLAINLNVIRTRAVNCSKIQSGHYFTKGIREQIANEVSTLEPTLIIVNTSLSPVQQRNLEKEWNTKVIDRTGLILEIFGARAQTKEGKIQVELAALEYQKSRLVRSWTHLGRQRGGAGFMGGPGERQIEIDRRLLSQRITRLKKELKEVSRTRDLSRQSRARVDFPIVALVGYTNAGKSTLFNNITKASVFAEDLLFATLDPTMRKATLANNKDIILSDTVGFISNLPTHLIAAFRSTLEQVIYADVIVHVMDCSKKDYNEQKNDVINILKDLDIDYVNDKRIIEAYNKSDLLSAEGKQDTARLCNTAEIPSCMISAFKNDNIDELMKLVSAISSNNISSVTYSININDGKAISWLYANGKVTKRSDNEDNVLISVNIDITNREKFSKNFGYKTPS